MGKTPQTSSKSSARGTAIYDVRSCDLELHDWRRRFAGDIQGDDELLLASLDTLRNVADTDCTVLLTGESGTGKELAARAVHAASPRAAAPFVPVNCAAIPDNLVESELFGHVRGAFTGASAARSGRVAAAAGGTLFLDEIGDMGLPAQAKLLRMLQDHTITPVGADVPVRIDVRIIAATNKDLEAMVREGTFRGDLYYRLSVIPASLPPLRDRGHDVLGLAMAFIQEANERHGRAVEGIDTTAQRALLTHNWPGNVRELAHLIERTVLLKRRGVITARDLQLRSMAEARTIGNPGFAIPGAAVASNDNLDLRSALHQLERRLIDEALERTSGNRTEAAALLGLNRTTLVEKIRKYAA